MMNEKEAIKIINNMPNCFPWEVEALYKGVKALEKIEKIQEIINIDNSVIQEDVMKYKMICEVIANDE